jgi:hypothetical protein
MPTALYCGRAESGLWGDPLNVATNPAFFVAARAVLQITRDPEA